MTKLPDFKDEPDELLKTIKELHDRAYQAGKITRELAADDAVFYAVTQWDDQLLSESQLSFRGQFDVCRKAVRQCLAEIKENEVSISFLPLGDTREDAAEVLNGMYRTDAQDIRTQESHEVAGTEAVVCGVGAWEIYTEYSSRDVEDDKQVIRRRPIIEANNCLYFDPNAKALDKSDADYVSILRAYSKDGYAELYYEMTGELIEDTADPERPGNFKSPEISYAFPWMGGEGEKIYVTTFYHRTLIKDTVLTFQNPFGVETTLYASEIAEPDIMDDMLDAGYEQIAERDIERYEIRKIIASGEAVLAEFVIPGQHIPVTPVYGERLIIEGEEYYEGIIRLAKDPQRLRNFQLSYLADIVSRSPRRKPIFLPEQIQGFESMYEQAGAENNYPYLLQNKSSGDGSELPYGPVGEMPDQPLPPALAASIDLTRQAIEDVAGGGVPQDYANSDLSGKAVRALQARIDMQTMIYVEHLKHAKRRDAEIYCSMAAEIYDTPRPVLMTMPDGTTEEVKLMEQVIDSETGDIVTLRDIANSDFEVTSELGPTYKSQREETTDRLQGMIAAMPPGDPMRQVLMLKALAIMDGVDFSDVRDYANKQLLLQGVKQPQNEEEQAILEEQAKQGNEPSPEMVLAKAEELKGQAAVARVELDKQKFKLEHELDVEGLKLDASKAAKELAIKQFEAESKRLKVQVDAKKTGTDLNFGRIDKFAKSAGDKIVNIR